MAKILGKNVVLKANGTQIASGRTISLDISDEMIDLSTQESTGVERAYGLESLAATADGLLSDANTQSILNLRKTNVTLSCEIGQSTPAAIISCGALVENININSEYNGVVTFSASFQSNGGISVA